MAEKEIKDHSLILAKLTGEKGTSFEMGKLTDDQDTRGEIHGNSSSSEHVSDMQARQLTGKSQWSVR